MRGRRQGHTKTLSVEKAAGVPLRPMTMMTPLRRGVIQPLILFRERRRDQHALRVVICQMALETGDHLVSRFLAAPQIRI